MPASDDSHNLLIEEHLVLRDAQKGDRQAFAALVERYWDRLYRWLYHLTHDRHAAEDLTQEAFCKALAHLDRFQAGTNFRAWLFDRVAADAPPTSRKAGAPGRARRRASRDLARSGLPPRGVGPVCR